MWPVVTTASFPPQREGALHREEIVYDLNPWVSDLHPTDSRCGRGQHWTAGQTTDSLIFPDPQADLGNSWQLWDPNIVPEGDFKSFVRVTGGRVFQSLPWGLPWIHMEAWALV